MVEEGKPKRRRLEDIEAGLRAKGTIGCHCLCPIIHPHKPGICTGAAQRNVSMFKGTDIQVEVSMCEPCAALHA
jgi:hypothetical protein